mmetsp:Transcript_40478/g.42242  ORF Transcript_40478/g.42242 Transcript_40478/m.42242 type:complete len:94 (+) Transcript_40478:16-297(+)
MALNNKKLITIITSVSLAVVATLVFVYYSLWALYSPFMEQSESQKYFLERKYVYVLPSLLFLVLVGVYLGIMYGFKAPQRKVHYNIEEKAKVQ